MAEDLEPLRRTMQELTDEIRSERLRRVEFTPLRMGAGLCQLGVLLLALLGVLQLEQIELFTRWILGAILLQLFTLALLLLDQRG